MKVNSFYSNRCKLKYWLFFLFLVGCEGMPPKPAGELCTIDLPRDQLICCPLSKFEKRTDLITLKETPTCTNVALELADKYIAVSPDTWGNIVLYTGKLERKADRCQKLLDDN